MKNFLPYTLTILLIIGCTKKELTPSEDQKKDVPSRGIEGIGSMFSFGSTITDGEIQYIAACNSWKDTANNPFNQALYSGIATFYNNVTGRPANVGIVNWGSVSIAPDSLKFGRWAYEFNLLNNTLHGAQFGSNTNFSVGGSGMFGSGNVTMYVPQEIFLIPEPYSCSTPIIYGATLPKTIYWNADANNTEGVSVMIEYNGFRTDLKNGTSTTSFFEPPINAPDNGQFNITSSMLTNFPAGSIITVHIGRANQESFTDSKGKKITVTAMTYTGADYVYQP